jgi:hypothetical protein
MLSHQDAWLAAIQEAVEKFHAPDTRSDLGLMKDLQEQIQPI